MKARLLRQNEIVREGDLGDCYEHRGSLSTKDYLDRLLQNRGGWIKVNDWAWGKRVKDINAEHPPYSQWNFARLYP